MKEGVDVMVTAASSGGVGLPLMTRLSSTGEVIVRGILFSRLRDSVLKWSIV